MEEKFCIILTAKYFTTNVGDGSDWATRAKAQGPDYFWVLNLMDRCGNINILAFVFSGRGK